MDTTFKGFMEQVGYEAATPGESREQAAHGNPTPGHKRLPGALSSLLMKVSSSRKMSQ